MQSEKDVTVTDVSTIVDGFVQTAEVDSQTDDEVIVEKMTECIQSQTEHNNQDVSVQYDPEEFTDSIVPETEVAEMQTEIVEEVTKIFPSLSDISMQTDEEEESPQREVVDSEVQTDVERMPEKETAEFEAQTVGLEKMDVEVQTEEEKTPESTEENDENVEAVSSASQTEEYFSPVPAFIERLYTVYSQNSKDESRIIDFDVNEALNDELKEKQSELENKTAEIEGLKSKLIELDKLKEGLIQMDKIKASLAELEHQNEELKEKLAETEAELTKMEAVVDSSLEEFGIVEARCTAAEREAEVKDNRIEDLCDEITEWKERCAMMTTSIKSCYPESCLNKSENLMEL